MKTIKLIGKILLKILLFPIALVIICVLLPFEYFLEEVQQ